MGKAQDKVKPHTGVNGCGEISGLSPGPSFGRESPRTLLDKMKG